MLRQWPTALILLLALLPFPAQAGWKYAEWGMSPEDVAEASGGEARISSSEGAKIKGYNLGNIAHHQEESYRFRVLFYYKQNGLALIKLPLKGPTSRCDNLAYYIKQKYGEPFDKRQNVVVYQRAWQLPGKNNLVTLLKYGSEELDGSSCVLGYKPLEGKNSDL